MSRPIVVTACMLGSSESWGPYQHPPLWHSRAGGGAVHGINSGHWLIVIRSPRRRERGALAVSNLGMAESNPAISTTEATCVLKNRANLSATPINRLAAISEVMSGALLRRQLLFPAVTSRGLRRPGGRQDEFANTHSVSNACKELDS